jgi:3-oxoadipate enol-lactonase
MDPVVLLHAGVCDRRMWDQIVPALHDIGRQVVAPDMRGFGKRPFGIAPFTHARDVLALLDGLGAQRADIVGASFGGRVALEVASLAPDRVASLALLAPGLPEWEWSEQIEAYGRGEEAAMRRGDVDEVVRLNVDIWGPNLSPADREYVEECVRGTAERDSEYVEEEAVDPPLAERLGAITARTQVAVGDADVPDFVAIARHLADTLPGPGLEVMPGAGHLLALERPDEVSALLSAWLRAEE